MMNKYVNTRFRNIQLVPLKTYELHNLFLNG